MTFKNFERVFNICLAIFLVAIITWFLADVFLTRKIDLKNSTQIEVHFKEMEKYRVDGKISYSYNLYTEEHEQFYKISADYTECFKLQSFLQNVNKGDLIKIYINKNTGLKSPNLNSIIGIVANDENFIDHVCINEKIEENKILIPLIFSILPLLLIITVIYKKWKTRNQKTNA